MLSLDKNHYYVKTVNVGFVWPVGATENTPPYALVLNPKNSKKYEYYDINTFEPNILSVYSRLVNLNNISIVIYEKVNLMDKYVKIPRIIILETSSGNHKYFVNKR